MKKNDQYFPAHSTVVDTIGNEIFYYVFSSDDHIIAERPETYRLATEEEIKFYERNKTQRERIVKLPEPESNFMLLHLLLTDDIRATMPSTTKIKMEWGNLLVRFDNFTKYGLHCIVEDTEENIVNWLKPFDGFTKGCGTPMLEKFSIAHVSETFKAKLQ